MKDYFILQWSDNNYHWIKKKGYHWIIFPFLHLPSFSSYIQQHLHHSLINNPVFFPQNNIKSIIFIFFFFQNKLFLVLFNLFHLLLIHVFFFPYHHHHALHHKEKSREKKINNSLKNFSRRNQSNEIWNQWRWNGVWDPKSKLDF